MRIANSEWDSARAVAGVNPYSLFARYAAASPFSTMVPAGCGR